MTENMEGGREPLEQRHRIQTDFALKIRITVNK